VIHLPLLLGHVAPVWDAREVFGPYQMLVGDYARSGRLLLWNPFTLAGEPAAIDPQLGAFSPVMLLFGLLFGGSRLGFELYWYCAWLLGPLGIIALARHLRAPAWGSYIVAAGLGLSGFYTGHAEHTIWLSTFSFLPLVIWRLDVALEKRQDLSFQPVVERRERFVEQHQPRRAQQCAAEGDALALAAGQLCGTTVDERAELEQFEHTLQVEAAFGQHSGDRRRDLRVDLVGRDLEDRLVPLHFVADLLQPLRQRPLGDRFAHLGHDDVNA
jgi:hypothetical protein